MDILTNKTYKEYDYLCRYTSFPYYYNTEDERYIQGLTSQLVDSSIYILHEVTPGETLDSIALDSYGNSTFFWVIADFNHIIDPFLSLKAGSYIKIPTLSSIKFKEI